ncbi:hypothetical protein BC829DRAFT_141484 [Chytridium lagenaria]|nr:hypothetical protein BC829DRAFT_141484 [Chytridium lagenaria]
MIFGEDGGRLKVLDISENRGMKSRFPQSVSLMTNLTTLRLFNRFGGPLPDLSGLTRLETCVLNQNPELCIPFVNRREFLEVQPRVCAGSLEVVPVCEGRPLRGDLGPRQSAAFRPQALQLSPWSRPPRRKQPQRSLLLPQSTLSLNPHLPLQPCYSLLPLNPPPRIHRSPPDNPPYSLCHNNNTPSPSPNFLHRPPQRH